MMMGRGDDGGEEVMLEGKSKKLSNWREYINTGLSSKPSFSFFFHFLPVKSACETVKLSPFHT